MAVEFRIQGIRRGEVLAQPLDGVTPQSLRISRPSKYVENEIVVVEASSPATGSRSQSKVIASRIDPSFLDGRPLKVLPLGEEGEHAFEEYVGFEDSEPFERALDTFRAGYHDDAEELLRAFIKAYPYHIDSYHHLGIIETEQDHHDRALKYFETGYRIGLLSIPNNFDGTLPWVYLENRPFLRAAHGYGLSLERKRRHVEAVDVYEQILALNPNDNQGIRHLLPSLYLKAQAPQKARAALEQHGADGMNLFTRCLLEIKDGHRIEAVRWLCRGLACNPHIPELVLSEQRLVPTDETHVVVGGKTEAADYLHQNDAWTRKQPRDFLKRVIALPSLASRLNRAFELKSALDSRDRSPLSDERTAMVKELFALFDDGNIPQILEEYRETV
ncbi:tetratricopeptide repeat protein [Planctomycetota bacterium]